MCVDKTTAHGQIILDGFTQNGTLVQNLQDKKLIVKNVTPIIVDKIILTSLIISIVYYLEPLWTEMTQVRVIVWFPSLKLVKL